jgi:hypothetical protein
MSSPMPPMPPYHYRFEAGNDIVSTTKTPATLHINGIDNTMYKTNAGPKLVSFVDKNYEHVNVSGGKHKSRRRKRNKSKKNRSRKNRRKTSRRRI